ncbi:MAG: CotH kinase family protein [Salibacteraceae bacterium]
MKKIIFIAMVLSVFSCKKELFVEYGAGLDDWTTESHSGNAVVNYDIVFNQNEVNRIDLVFTSEDWADMQEDLEDIVGTSTGGGPGGGGGGPGGGEQTFSDQTPAYFECQLFFNGKEWYHVGVRYKGNSSLSASSNKLPLRFKFDEFEDTYIVITNQTFYGFKELSLGSNYNDEAVMRDKTASDVFRNFGVPAVQTAFYEIWIDTGSGSAQYYGVYTMNEVVFDSFLANYFGSETGNCYKPDGDGAAFSASGFSLADFELKNNDGANKSEIQEMYDILHSSDRTSNPSQWRSNLESVFDVNGFLKYLAANNTMQNWDTYGNMTHNYYLYHDPADGLLKWIVWDNNEAFTSGTGNRTAVSISMSEVSTDWPLINYLIDQAEYEVVYKNYLSSFISSSFENNRMDDIYSTQQSLLYKSVSNEQSGYSYVNGIGNFTSGVSTLKSHCTGRISTVNSYL